MDATYIDSRILLAKLNKLKEQSDRDHKNALGPRGGISPTMAGHYGGQQHIIREMCYLVSNLIQTKEKL